MHLVTTLVLFAGTPSFSQDLPEFDDEDFEVVAVLSDSKVLVKSDGRDFYCRVDSNGSAGYIEILAWSCLPFVNRGETLLADKRLAEAEAVAKAAADAAAAEELRVAKAKADETLKAAKAAAIVGKEQEEKRLQEMRKVFSTVDISVLKDAILNEARSRKFFDCQLIVGAREISMFSILVSLVSRVGLDVDLFDKPARQAAQERFAEAIVALEEDQLVEFNQNQTKLKLKECN